MRVPLSWLNDFAPFGDDYRALAETLDDLGLVVERTEVVGEGLSGVVAARVTAIEPIEGAQRIRKVTVEAGSGPVEVVCGAFNFSVGDVVPFAPVGTVLPDGMEIARRRMRGVTSNGMLCSGAELGLSDDAAGLLVLDSQAEPGRAVMDTLGLQPEVVFELAIEGDRPDAWSMAGVARTLAARLGLPFKLPDLGPAPPAAGPAVAERASLVVEALDLCPRFTARVLSGVVVAPSSPLVARRLELAGMRPINNVVDASNYVMLEIGQPTHPYDLSRLAGRGLRVRRARPGERLVTLDGVARTLGEAGPGLGDTGEDCLICDAADIPVGIAGIMGGSSSEISDSTTEVLVEAAYFSPLAVTRTATRLALRTEAQARFSKGTDPQALERAHERIGALLGAHGGRWAPGMLEARGQVPEPFVVDVRPGDLSRVLGVEFDARAVSGLLEPLGFRVDGGRNALAVTVPTSRPDIRPAPLGVADVAEEVARAHGYARLGRTRPSWPDPGRLAPRQRERRRLLEVLAGLGATEAWTSSLVGPRDHEAVGLVGLEVELANPQQADQNVLRRSLLPGLLKAVAANEGRREGDRRLFEVGVVFAHPDDTSLPTAEARGGSARGALDVPIERELAAVALARHDDDATTAVAAWQVVTEALRLEGVKVVNASGRGDASLPVPPGLHPTRSGWLVAGGEVVGSLGEVDAQVLERFGLSAPGNPRRLGWLELDLGPLLDHRRVPRRASEAVAVSRYPSSDVDLAFVVGDWVPADAVASSLRRAAGDLLESLRLFDVFRAEALGSGRRSLTFRLRFSALDHTLTDEEVGKIRARCVEAVVADHGAVLRG